MTGRKEPASTRSSGGGRAYTAAEAASGKEGKQSLIRLETVLISLAILALAVLIVLPVSSLLAAALWAPHGLTGQYFQRAETDRLYVTPLINSLILGGWTGL